MVITFINNSKNVIRKKEEEEKLSKQTVLATPTVNTNMRRTLCRGEENQFVLKSLKKLSSV